MSVEPDGDAHNPFGGGSGLPNRKQRDPFDGDNVDGSDPFAVPVVEDDEEIGENDDKGTSDA